MSDFKPEFRDGIGYCHSDCSCKAACMKAQVYNHICWWGHVCIPWVRSLLKEKQQRHSKKAERFAKACGWYAADLPGYVDYGPELPLTYTYGDMEGVPIPDEKVRNIVELFGGVHGLIDAYRAEVRKSDKVRWEQWVSAELKKGTPMSADNVIYVQKRTARSAHLGTAWHVWEDSVIREPPVVPVNGLQYPGRTDALCLAHDLARRVSPSRGVQELPDFVEPPPKTQAQQDAEWLREHADSLQGNFGKSLEPTRLKEIATRLKEGYQ